MANSANITFAMERRQSNEPRDHHYTPQFYLRRFAAHDDAAKVNPLWRHEPFVFAGRRSRPHRGPATSTTLFASVSIPIGRGGAACADVVVNSEMRPAPIRSNIANRIVRSPPKVHGQLTALIVASLRRDVNRGG